MLPDPRFVGETNVLAVDVDNAVAGQPITIRATTPLTTGAAMLVPVRLRYGLYAVATEPVIRYADLVVYIVLVG